MADLEIIKDTAYDKKVAGIAVLHQEMKDRAPLLLRLAKQGKLTQLRQWRNNDPLLDEIIKFIRQGNDFLSEMMDLLDD